MNDINDPIREYQQRLSDLANAAERLRPVLRSCEDAIQRAGVTATISVGRTTPRDPKVEMLLPATTLKEAVPVLRELAKEGLHTDKNDSHQDQNVFDVMATRTYNLGPHCSLTLVIINGGPMQAGPSCRMEKVGERTVPVYEMVCDEQEPPAIARGEG